MVLYIKIATFICTYFVFLPSKILGGLSPLAAMVRGAAAPPHPPTAYANDTVDRKFSFLK